MSDTGRQEGRLKREDSKVDQIEGKSNENAKTGEGAR